MGMTPTTPQLKSFWERPEGKTGLITLLAGGALGLYGLYFLLPFLITIMTNTLYLVGLGVALFAVVYVLMNGTFQTLIKFGFKSIMRWLTGIFIEIDPIGILKNFVVEMKAQREMLQNQIAKVRGAIQTLDDNITANVKKADRCHRIAVEAKTQQDATNEPTLKNTLAYKIAENIQQENRVLATNKELNVLKVNLDKMYKLLIRWDAATQYYINDRENQVNEFSIKRKAVNAAYSAMSSAKRILRGNSDENALYDQTLEFLSEDASTKLGEMADFARISEDFMLNIDLENGAANHDALQQLESLSQKLLPPSSAQPGFIDAMPSNQAQLQPVARTSSAGSNYEDLLK